MYGPTVDPAQRPPYRGAEPLRPQLQQFNAQMRPTLVIPGGDTPSYGPLLTTAFPGYVGYGGLNVNARRYSCIGAGVPGPNAHAHASGTY